MSGFVCVDATASTGVTGASVPVAAVVEVAGVVGQFGAGAECEHAASTASKSEKSRAVVRDIARR
jgi:hypothetical protein